MHAKVLLAIQQLMMLEGLLAAFEPLSGIEVVGATSRPFHAAQLVRSLVPDVVVLGVEPAGAGAGL
ncbi:MAG: DNA-binding response regulator, partial [Actinomycetota bacterium]